MDAKHFTVYCHENRINGKRYVGITGNIPEKRWSNGRGYKHNAYFTNAIKKYGWENFDHEIVITGIDKEYAMSIEKMLIHLYRTNDTNYGYNLSSGGDPMRGVKHSEETKRKMSEAAKGRVVSEETKRKLSIIMKNRPEEMREKFAHCRAGHSSWCKGIPKELSHNYGRKYSEERRDNISSSLTKFYIKHIPTGKIYTSYHELQKEHDVSYGSIYRSCRRARKSTEWLFIPKEEVDLCETKC